MKRALALLALAFATPLAALPGGELGTLPSGTFRCEMPGDALGPFIHRKAEDDFTIITASTYSVGNRLGSYLLIGNRLVMTSGPFRDRRYHAVSQNFLRVLEPDGSDGLMRCVHARGIRR